MSFNPDPNQQAIEVLFSRRVDSDDHPKLTFNGNQVQWLKSMLISETLRIDFR